jgi:hypothetical protein
MLSWPRDRHDLALRRAALGEHLAEGLAQAVQGVAGRKACGPGPLLHAHPERLRRERAAVLRDQHGLAAPFGLPQHGDELRMQRQPQRTRPV